MGVTLPTEKTTKSLSATTAKVLLYGVPKIGKTTLAAGVDPDHTLYLATEPGIGAHELYAVTINSWQDFRDICGLLANPEAREKYTTVVIDTVDELFLYCQNAACEELGISYPGDLEFGKGWKAVSDKWRQGVGYISSLGMGIWFVSHAKDEEIKQRVGTHTKSVPTVTGKAREFLLGFCDHIFYATSMIGPEGEETRVLRTRPSVDYEAGSRQDDLPDPLPLDAGAVLAALSAEVLA